MAILSAGVGAGLGALVTAYVAVRQARKARAATMARLDRADERLERIEHIVTAPDQAWFWTPEWQAGEAEADADLAAGRSTVYASESAFLAALDAAPAADEPTRAGR